MDQGLADLSTAAQIDPSNIEYVETLRRVEEALANPPDAPAEG